ncbi:MAG: hypothetical protein ACREDL_12540, partial [Bradyrhizobium sp.]
MVHSNKIFKAAVVVLFVGLIQNGSAFSADSTEVTKILGESDAAFVERITKHEITSASGGNQQLASTSALIKGSETLIAFTEVRDPSDRDPEPAHDIYIQVFLKQSDLSYAWIGNALAC